MNNWLIYGTGGVAVANLKINETFASTSAAGLAGETISATKTKAGWVAGGGVEFALNNKMSVRAEYLYLKINNISDTGTFCAQLPACNLSGTSTQSMDFSESIARLAINWKP